MEAFASFVERKDFARISSSIASTDQPSSVAKESTFARIMVIVASAVVWEELEPRFELVFVPQPSF